MATLSFPKPFYLVGLAVAFALAAGPLSSAGQDKNSADIKGRIEEKFKQQGLLVGNDIQVTVEEKTITLTGNVRTLAIKEQAGRDAQSVAKNFKIRNDLALVNSGLSPQQMAEGIMAAIDKSSDYFIFDFVGVDINSDGEATLNGWTSYPWSATEFVKLVESQPGVTKVNNEIRRTMIMEADRTLRTQVAQLIYKRPVGPSFARMNGPVHIIVSNNTVTLGGTVEKESDAGILEELVRTNTRAMAVVNMLRVRKK